MGDCICNHHSRNYIAHLVAISSTLLIHLNHSIMKNPFKRYFNTTNESKPQVEVNTKKAMSQDKMILAFMRLTKMKFGASSLEKSFSHKNWPITSIRRSLNTLEKTGEIKRCFEKQTTPYGRTEYIYIAKNV